MVVLTLGPMSFYCKQFSPVKFGRRISEHVLLSKQSIVAMPLLALLSASLFPMFPLVAFPCLFPPCLDSPDSAVRVFSPTAKTPDSRSAKQNWRILGITHVWWRTNWGRTTPLALLTSKAVSTNSLATSEVAQICIIIVVVLTVLVPNERSEGAIANGHVTVVTCMKNNCPHMWLWAH